MLRRIKTCVFDCVLNEGSVGQSLESCSGLGDHDENCMSDVNLSEDCRSVIRINVADELGFHLQCIVDFCPALKSEVQSTRAEVAAADTDLADSRELLAVFIGNFACMNFICKFRSSLLLRHIEFSLVHSVSDNIFAELAAAQLMKNKALLTCVDDFAVVESGIFLCQFSFIRELLENSEDVIIYLLCSKVVDHAVRHRYAVLFHSLGAVLSCHSRLDINDSSILKLFVGIQ